MKHKRITLIILLFAVSLIAITVYAQDSTLTPSSTPTPSQALPISGVDLSFLAKHLVDIYFWIALLTTLVAGAAGGVVYELLILQGNIELPHKPIVEEMTEKYPHAIGQYIYDLGIWARVIIGAMAAVAALLFLTPESSFELLATAIVAGSAGSSIFSSMQHRLSATIAQRDVTILKSIVAEQRAKVDEAKESINDLKTNLGKILTDQELPTRALTLEEAATTHKESLKRVEQLLNEAIGVEQLLNEAIGIHEAAKKIET